MSFLYPRTIAISRPGLQTGVGQVGYGGVDVVAETPIISGVPASIQYSKSSEKPITDVPSNISKKSMWKIFFILPIGTVDARDIITDDQGVRYQVAAPYWNSMGYQAIAERLDS